MRSVARRAYHAPTSAQFTRYNAKLRNVLLNGENEGTYALAHLVRKQAGVNRTLEHVSIPNLAVMLHRIIKNETSNAPLLGDFLNGNGPFLCDSILSRVLVAKGTELDPETISTITHDVGRLSWESETHEKLVSRLSDAVLTQERFHVKRIDAAALAKLYYGFAQKGAFQESPELEPTLRNELLRKRVGLSNESIAMLLQVIDPAASQDTMAFFKTLVGLACGSRLQHKLTPTSASTLLEQCVEKKVLSEPIVRVVVPQLLRVTRTQKWESPQSLVLTLWSINEMKGLETVADLESELCSLEESLWVTLFTKVSQRKYGTSLIPEHALRLRNLLQSSSTCSSVLNNAQIDYLRHKAKA